MNPQSGPPIINDSFVYAMDTSAEGYLDTPADIDNTLNTIDSAVAEPEIREIIPTGGAQPDQIVSFAKTLMGTPYRYGSTDPSVGFDCSGFITHVFRNFKISVPRSSVEFTDVGKEVSLSDAKPGDLILFTGTDSTVTIVGHMGIIIEDAADGKKQFIHSSSGKANGVTISPVEGYYSTRFVKVVRIFNNGQVHI